MSCGRRKFLCLFVPLRLVLMLVASFSPIILRCGATGKLEAGNCNDNVSDLFLSFDFVFVLTSCSSPVFHPWESKLMQSVETLLPTTPIVSFLLIHLSLLFPVTRLRLRLQVQPLPRTPRRPHLPGMRPHLFQLSSPNLVRQFRLPSYYRPPPQ